ncbi:hypothetical protein A9995_04935 [Erythrobacter sp. QSSC1-22B]|nr:glycosyltransferase family 4 protein [Erythrobacter sp. QSSC1-22B]OBX19898.1 hypothetical protein A9995_04935 [Erythrobacter sp. QSSC1-22B]
MPSEKSVLLVRSDLNLAGPAILIHATALALRDTGWSVELATGGGALVERFETDGFVHHTVPGLARADRGPAAIVSGILDLRGIAGRGRTQVIHSFNAQAGFVAWLAVVGLKAKVINTVLGAGKERVLPWMPFDFIAVSGFVRRALVDAGVAPHRINVIYNALLSENQVFDDGQFVAAWAAREPTHAFRVVSVAMMNGDKGHQAVLEALTYIRRKDPSTPIRVEFVGDGARRPQLEQFAADNGLTDLVSFAGAAADVYPYLDRAHAMIHLSRQETFGMVLAEAQARGLPVVAYAIGGIPEVVVDGAAGILVPDGDVAAAAESMMALAADRNWAQSMGRAGLERCRDTFMQWHLAENLEAAYRQS